MTAKTGPRGRHDGPRGRQDGPKMAPKNGFPPLMSRYWPPRAFKVPPGPLQDRFFVFFFDLLVDFRFLFGRFWVDFCLIFYSLFDRFLERILLLFSLFFSLSLYTNLHLHSSLLRGGLSNAGVRGGVNPSPKGKKRGVGHGVG